MFLGYVINDRRSVQLNLPIIYRSYGDNNMHASTSGVGDMSVIGNYTAYQKLTERWTFNWHLMGGVKFPTGNPDALARPDTDFPEGIGGHDVALGSGSYDGLVGTGIYARWRKAFFDANLQYAIRSEGAFQHQYANDLTW